jgi:hypothetical protein
MADFPVAHPVTQLQERLDTERASERNSIIVALLIFGTIAAASIYTGSALGAFALLLLGGLIYFAPTLIARHRMHRNTLAIFMLQLVFIAAGLIFFYVLAVIGWLAAVVWACTSNTRQNEAGHAQ